jgi:hypothetical protein
VGNYEFGWTAITETTIIDPDGNPVTSTTMNPVSIRVHGIEANIARAIRSGLNREATKNHTIGSVVVKEVVEGRAELAGQDP